MFLVIETHAGYDNLHFYEGRSTEPYTSPSAEVIYVSEEEGEAFNVFINRRDQIQEKDEDVDVHIVWVP